MRDMTQQTTQGVVPAWDLSDGAKVSAVMGAGLRPPTTPLGGGDREPMLRRTG